ncbi:nitrogen fixation protein NifZ [Thalassolituus sp.]|jgi:nitrogen fixation protein NifZ|uniref:nitrogen fixation protein NifZ n=1 Tax=Thalassolituus sp. TaxID=2030822 RepID=UPI002A7EEA09|nr:nitrogen fixation protein NifZ [Thalassolituus sp.]|tara:strand:- start:4896 stop:5369 length:474 start_codon:yes stop_codon:yes gene_type:complete
MKPAYEYGDEVRLTRNVRNDGTYPGKEVGELLIRRGSVGCVYDVGTYLQDQLIYRVHFLDDGCTVGCREEELVPAADPWINNRFEFREAVVALIPMSSEGKVVVEVGDEGEISRVIRDDNIVLYHARFHGRTFQVPEAALAAPDSDEALDSRNQEAS